VIRVRVQRSRQGSPVALMVEGHAGRGAYGEDIVCAAASALVETLMLGLTEVVAEIPQGRVDDGLADLRFFQPMSGEARAIVETIVRGLKDLASTEPDAVSVTDETYG
jgi:uncharacterized protein YsxB (DUF464 family)